MPPPTGRGTSRDDIERTHAREARGVMEKREVVGESRTELRVARAKERKCDCSAPADAAGSNA